MKGGRNEELREGQGILFPTTQSDHCFPVTRSSGSSQSQGGEAGAVARTASVGPSRRVPLEASH